ncbi:AAA family ATPase [Micromonospora sp. NPDC048999]|uniref:AAA family ATPase n=1 Tax=Micromonospora sp. NPDC048999 TaxID=3155391 RepID=UPI0033F5AC63
MTCQRVTGQRGVDIDGKVIGRECELAALNAFLEQAAGRALVLVGEPGSGKTTLFRHGLRTAAATHLVMSCAPAESESSLSFVAMADLLDGPAGSGLDQMPPRQREALEAVRTRGDAPELTVVMAGFVSLVRLLSSARPVLIAVDDVQWLDPESAQVLFSTARRVTGHPVTFLLTSRIGEARAETILSAFDDSRKVESSVGPMSANELHGVIRQALGRRLSRPELLRVYEACGGYPLHGVELVRALHLGDSPGAHSLSISVEGLLRNRIDALPPRIREVLELAACLTRPTVEELVAAVGVERAETATTDAREATLAALSAAAAADLLVARAGQVRFTHPLIANAVRSDLSPEHARRLHTRLAHVVADAERRARHLAHSLDGPDEHAADMVETAAVLAVARGASSAAAELYELAARLTPSEQAEPLRRRLQEAAEHHFASGDKLRARQLLEGLLDRAEGATRATVLVMLANLYGDDLDRALALNEEAIIAAGEDRTQAGMAEHGIGMNLLVRRADAAGGLIHLRRAAELLPDEAPVRARALTNLASVEYWTGPTDEVAVRRAAELGRAMKVGQFYDSGDFWLGHRRMLQARYDEARTAMHRVIEAARQAGDDFSVAGGLIHFTELEIRADDWTAAQRSARECAALCEQFDGSQGGIGPYVASLVAAHLGHGEEAERLATEGAAAAVAGRDEIFRIQNVGVLGFLRLSQGDAEGAADLLGPLPAHLASLGWREPTMFPVWDNAIEALIGVGELDRAERYLNELEANARAYGSPLAIQNACRCRGVLQSVRGDHAEAVATLTEAHTIATGVFTRGRAGLALGTVLRRDRQISKARNLLESARETFASLPAPLWVALAEREIRQLGGRTASSGLTQAEQDVELLVMEGLSNHQIATRLGKSEKTVAAQLTSVYAKRGVSSRAELMGRRDNPAGPFIGRSSNTG